MSMLGLRLRTLWLRVPGIGGLARLARQPGLAGKWDGTWRHSELQLCHMFQGYLNAISRDSFNNYLSYLGKSGDTGRTPASAWLKWSVAMAVVLESAGLSYVLFPELSLTRTSVNTAMVMTVGASVLAGLTLLYFMHQAGGQAYKNHLIAACKRHGALDASKPFPAKIAETQANLPQASDDADPPEIQCLRRVGSETGIQSMLVAGVLLVAIAGYSTVVLVKNQANRQSVESVSAETAASQTANSRERPGNAALPENIPDRPSSAASDRAETSAGLGTDMVLGVMFLVTQMIGVGIGYRHQLAGKQGKIAYESTLGFATYEEYFSYHDGQIMHLAEYWLKELQRTSKADGGTESSRTHHSFREFLFLTRQDEIRYDLKNIPHRESKRESMAAHVDGILVKITELKRQNMRAEAIALIQDLPEPEKTEVKERLQSLNASHADEPSLRAAERKELEKIL